MKQTDKTKDKLAQIQVFYWVPKKKSAIEDPYRHFLEARQPVDLQ